MSRPGHRNTLQALTPLTATDSSPPGKLGSPRSTKSAYDTMDKAARSRAAPPSDAITPVNTPPETRMSIFPSDGLLGERLTYDPLLDSKLDKKTRHSRAPIYKQILDKVRCARYTPMWSSVTLRLT